MKREALLLLINVVLALAAALVILGFHIFPKFTAYLIILCGLAFLFILTEQWKTHYAAEFENRFWTLMAFLFAQTCLFCDDSPVKMLKGKDGISWCIVFLFTYLAHIFDRHLRRIQLARSPNIKKIKSCTFDANNRQNAKSKTQEITDLLCAIDLTWFSSTFLNLFFLSRVLSAEQDIIRALTDANARELNLIINNIQLPLIVYKIKDHRFARQPNRTKVLDLLAKERVHELSVTSKVLVLDAIQKLKLTAVPHGESLVKNIIFSTKGDDLSELKCMADAKGDFNSMHKLIYVDLRNAEIKQEILQYFSSQAMIQLAHNKINSKVGKRRGQFAWRKILSDVDDTLSCSGGSWPAGVDSSYPKKAIYPGVLAFYRELDLGVSGKDEWDNDRIGNLVFLSARPHVYKDVSENASYTKFQGLQESKGLYTSPTLLAGSLDTGSQFMFRNDLEPIARKKYENFLDFLKIYPEFTYIFVGDNGQGDVRTAEMVYDSCYRENLHRVYIHLVQDIEKTHVVDKKFKTLPSKANRDHNNANHDSRVCYFLTYVDAAIDAFEHNLIRLSSLRRIMLEAVKDFLSISAAHWAISAKFNNTHAITAAASLPVVKIHRRILSSREKALKHSGSAKRRPSHLNNLISPLRIKAFAYSSDSGSRAHTSRDSGSEVSDAAAAAPLISNSTPSEQSLGAGSRASEEEAHFKRELRARELNRALERANEILTRQSAGGVETVQLIPYSQVYVLGQRVKTDFGEGIIESFREVDGIYTIAIYANKSSTDSARQSAPSENAAEREETGKAERFTGVKLFVPLASIQCK